MKILIGYPGTIEKSGGMQYICAQFANAMIERGHTVAICWYGGKEVHSFYKFPDLMKVFSLRPDRISSEMPYHDVGKDISSFNKMLRELLRLFSRKSYRQWNDYCKKKILAPKIKSTVQAFQPDVIISFSLDMTVFFSEIMTEIPVITMIHTDPKHVFQQSYSAELKALRKSYAIQVLSPSYVKEVHNYCPGTRVVYIPNPVHQMRYYATDKEKTKGKYYIIDVARINKDKQQHILVKAFASLAADFPDWNLELWGDNQTYFSYVNSINQFVKQNQLENRVFMRGTTDHVEDVYQKADIFAFPSAYEGFGLALVEAMSAGLPAVAFKECTSVNELIKNGETGFLVEDGVKPLTKKLACLMRNKELRMQFGQNAHIEAEKFAPVHVWDAWENLLNNAVSSFHQL